MTIEHQSDRRRRAIGWGLTLVLGLAMIGGSAAVLLPYESQRARAEPAIPAGVSLASWFDNGKGDQHVLRIVKGDAPSARVRVAGTVKTDADCDPDAQGLNHCHNRIALDTGRTIEVVHDHAMHRYPCLAPGQRLSITGLDGNWVVAHLDQPQRAD